MTWSTGEDGRAFMRGSNDRWYDADVADGADPADARLRADRTLGLLHRAGGAGLRCTPSTCSATRCAAGSSS